MAEPKKPGKQHTPRQDDIIESLVADPSQVPDVQMLVGFVGKSSRDGYSRLYLNPELTEYFDIPDPDENIVSSRQLPIDQTPLGGTVLWVRRKADLLHTRTTTSREAQAGFLQGDIAERISNVGGIEGGPPLGPRDVGPREFEAISGWCTFFTVLPARARSIARFTARSLPGSAHGDCAHGTAVRQCSRPFFRIVRRV